jgi:alpha-tubulin suppressor-like RCC1 family protein
MNSFTTIPFVDLLSFLSSHSISTDNYQAYEIALKIIRSDQAENSQLISTPISVLDWIIADKLSSTDISIDRFTTSAILLSSDYLLKELANILTLNHVNKERITRILGYLNLLDNDISIFDTLPDDILFIILQNLDCHELLLTSLISSKFNKLSQKEGVTQILRNKLRERTRLNLDQYNRKELNFLIKYKERLNISAAHEHRFYIKNGNVYTFGEEINDHLNTDIPILVSNLNNIKQVSVGGNHTLVLTKDGQVYSFGDNLSGQLGLGHTYSTIDPTLISGLNNIVQISAGGNHSLLLTEDGQVYCFGHGRFGRLGLGDYNNRTIPSLVSNITNVVQISAGENTSLLLNKNGEIYSFGSNYCGKAGHGSSKCQLIPTLIPTNYFNNSPIVQISASSCHSLALTIEGNVYSFGYGGHGRLGLGDYKNRTIPTLIPAAYFNNIPVSYVSAGRYYSLILTENGQLYSIGDKFYQRLGIKENYRDNVPILIKGFENIIDVSLGGHDYLMVNKYGEIHYMSKAYKSEEMIHGPLLLDKIS